VSSCAESWTEVASKGVKPLTREQGCPRKAVLGKPIQFKKTGMEELGWLEKVFVYSSTRHRIYWGKNESEKTGRAISP